MDIQFNESRRLLYCNLLWVSSSSWYSQCRYSVHNYKEHSDQWIFNLMSKGDYSNVISFGSIQALGILFAHVCMYSVQH